MGPDILTMRTRAGHTLVSEHKSTVIFSLTGYLLPGPQVTSANTVDATYVSTTCNTADTSPEADSDARSTGGEKYSEGVSDRTTADLTDIATTENQFEHIPSIGLVVGDGEVIPGLELSLKVAHSSPFSSMTSEALCHFTFNSFYCISCFKSLKYLPYIDPSTHCISRPFGQSQNLTAQPHHLTISQSHNLTIFRPVVPGKNFG